MEVTTDDYASFVTLYNKTSRSGSEGLKEFKTQYKGTIRTPDDDNYLEVLYIFAKNGALLGRLNGWVYEPRYSMRIPFTSGSWHWLGPYSMVDPREQWQDFDGIWYLLGDYNKWKDTKLAERVWPEADPTIEILMAMNSKTNRWESINLNDDELGRLQDEYCLGERVEAEFCNLTIPEIKRAIHAKNTPKSPGVLPSSGGPNYLREDPPPLPPQWRTGGKRRTKRQRKHKKRSIKRRN